MPDVGVPDAAASCGYGVTMFGHESDDDDCKYHLRWSSTPICEGVPGVLVTVVVTQKTDRTNAMDGGAAQPLTGDHPGMEAFTTSPGDWDSATFCDTMSTHFVIPPGNTGYWPMTESSSTPGTYTGFVQFDQAGQWTLRFHFRHNCYDLLPDSPHGHAAYHLTVP
jgi:hypothetical protein